MENQLSMIEAICLSIAAYPFQSQRFILQNVDICLNKHKALSNGSNGSYWFNSGKFKTLWHDVSNRKIKHSSGSQRVYISKLVLTPSGWDIHNKARKKLGYETIQYYKQEE